MFKKALIAILLVTAGFAAGVFVGCKFFSQAGLWTAAVGESFVAMQYAHIQYREAEYPAAVEAMEAYVGYLERMQPGGGRDWRPGADPWLDERGQNLDMTLAWIRLALLHERHGNEEAAADAWAQVDSLAAKGNWKDRSREHLREVVGRLDGSLPATETDGGRMDPSRQVDPD